MRFAQSLVNDSYTIAGASFVEYEKSFGSVQPKRQYDFEDVCVDDDDYDDDDDDDNDYDDDDDDDDR